LAYGNQPAKESEMRINVISVDHAPPELEGQTPFQLELLRKISGNDRPDYWIAVAAQPIRWVREGQDVLVTHVVVTARWLGTQIAPGMRQLPINIAYVTDSSLLDDASLDFKKSAFVAIGTADESQPTTER
jgi:hypothetical protein